MLLETRILNENAYNGHFSSTEHTTFDFPFYKMITLYFKKRRCYPFKNAQEVQEILQVVVLNTVCEEGGGGGGGETWQITDLACA